MKTLITNQKGLVVEREGDGFFIEGQQLEEAAFDNRWIDLFAEIHEGTGNAALTYEAYRDTGFCMRFFRSNQNDKIFMVYQMPHGWAGTDVHPHMHCLPMAAGTGDVILEYQYCWAPFLHTVPAASGWFSGSVTASYTPSDQYRHQVISLGLIDPPVSGVLPSSMLFFAVSRPGATNPGDTYDTAKPEGTNSANFGILFFDAHVQMAKAGSQAEDHLQFDV